MQHAAYAEKHTSSKKKKKSIRRENKQTTGMVHMCKIHYQCLPIKHLVPSLRPVTDMSCRGKLQAWSGTKEEEDLAKCFSTHPCSSLSKVGSKILLYSLIYTVVTMLYQLKTVPPGNDDDDDDRPQRVTCY